MPDPIRWTRRRFVTALGAASLAPLACSNSTEPVSLGSARLEARPGTPTSVITPGTWPLGIGPSSHDGFLHVPAGYLPTTPMPLVLALHGAGSRASGPLEIFRPYAESRGFLLLAVDSVGMTWDAITFKYQADVAFIDEALAHVFARCAVDPARVVVEGFSDGASYALGLGLANGDLFRRVVAFSPGGIPLSDTANVGEPDFFISHGRQDTILPVQVSQAITTYLRNQGYEVTYYEFDGGHQINADVAPIAADWMVHQD